MQFEYDAFLSGSGEFLVVKNAPPPTLVQQPAGAGYAAPAAFDIDDFIAGKGEARVDPGLMPIWKKP